MQKPCEQSSTAPRRRETVFFDLDDTLYDRAVPYEAAFRVYFGDRFAGMESEAFRAFIRRGYEGFHAVHDGSMTTRQMHIYRHQAGLRDIGIDITPEQALEMQALYAAQQSIIHLSGTMQAVLDLCLARFAGAGIITNGAAKTQAQKLRSLDIGHWVKPEMIFISDAVGIQKPAPEIFRLAEHAAGGPCICVGDSYAHDIAGAAACGWTTIWLDRRGDTPGTPPPDHTAASEEALLQCLEALSAQAAI